MRHLQAAVTATVLALNVIASFTPMPIPLKGALLMFAFWLIGANVGCILAEKRVENLSGDFQKVA